MLLHQWINAIFPQLPLVLTCSDGLQRDMHIAQGDVGGSRWATLKGRVAGGQRAEQRAARGRALALGLSMVQSRGTGHWTLEKRGWGGRALPSCKGRCSCRTYPKAAPSGCHLAGQTKNDIWEKVRFVWSNKSTNVLQEFSVSVLSMLVLTAFFRINTSIKDLSALICYLTDFNTAPAVIWKAHHGQVLQALETLCGAGWFSWGHYCTWTSHAAKHVHVLCRSLQEGGGVNIINHPCYRITSTCGGLVKVKVTNSLKCTCKEVHWLEISLNLGFDWLLREVGGSFRPERSISITVMLSST